jgi:hypothetical protein
MEASVKSGQIQLDPTLEHIGRDLLTETAALAELKTGIIGIITRRTTFGRFPHTRDFAIYLEQEGIGG